LRVFLAVINSRLGNSAQAAISDIRMPTLLILNC
jgi:hypothetical protein